MNSLDNLKIISDDVGELTLKEYLKLIFSNLWAEGEEFNSKRPFGNSDWQWKVYEAMIREKVIEGTIDDYGDIQDFNEAEAGKIIIDYIREKFK